MATSSSSTRDRLLDEALALFATKGFAATTSAEIEQAAGLTAGAGGLFRHFRSKQDVLRAAVDRQLTRLEGLRRLRSAVPTLDDPRAELALIATYLFGELAEEAVVLGTIFAAPSSELSEMGDAVRAFTADLAAEVAAWIRRSAGDVDADALAEIAVGGLLYHRLANVRLGPLARTVGDERLLRAWTDTLSRLVGAPRVTRPFDGAE